MTLTYYNYLRYQLTEATVAVARTVRAIESLNEIADVLDPQEFTRSKESLQEKLEGLSTSRERAVSLLESYEALETRDRPTTIVYFETSDGYLTPEDTLTLLRVAQSNGLSFEGVAVAYSSYSNGQIAIYSTSSLETDELDHLVRSLDYELLSQQREFEPMTPIGWNGREFVFPYADQESASFSKHDTGSADLSKITLPTLAESETSSGLSTIAPSIPIPEDVNANVVPDDNGHSFSILDDIDNLLKTT